MARGAEIRHFFTKVAGVTHKNADGSDRQKHIGKCQQIEQTPPAIEASSAETGMRDDL